MTAAVEPPAALVAASAPVDNPADVFKTGLGGRRRLAWQEEAWQHYDQVSEFKFYVQFVATSCSRARLVASAIDPDTGLPTGSVDEDDKDGMRFAEMVKRMAGGPLGQAQIIRRTAELLKVPGELWTAIVVRPSPFDANAKVEQWVPLTIDDIKPAPRGDGIVIELPDGKTHEFNKNAGDGMFRTWISHAKKASEADSAARSCADSMREIVRTTLKIENADDSRIRQNGLLMFPQEASLPRTQAPVSAGKPGPEPAAPTAQMPAATQLQQLLLQVAAKGSRDPRSPEALMPIVGSAPGEFIDKIRHIQFGKDVSADEIKKREAAMRRLAIGLDISPERLTGLGDTNHWCVDDQTEALTQQGWKRHADLRVGDLVLTLNHTTGMSEWKPVLTIYRAPVMDEPMRELKTSRHNSLTTMNHRWPVLRSRGTPKLGTRVWAREWTTSGEMGEPHKIITAAPSADIPTEAKFTDEFVELIAWYWTEGSQSAGGQFTIAQSHTVHSDNVDRIRGVLTRMGASWTERVQPNELSHGGPVTVFSIRKATSDAIRAVVPGRDKIVPLAFIHELTAAQLELFIEVSCLGDGWHLRHGVRDIWQKNPAALDAFELALVLAGHATSRHASSGGVAVRALDTITQRPSRLNLTHERNGAVIRLYSGVVWCPTTENGTWFARRNGQVFYTGNSSRGIADDDVQLHLAPVLEVICQSYYDNVFRNMLVKEGIDPDKYILWYDTSRLTADPDLTDEANAGLANGTITGEAWVKAVRLPEDSLHDFDSLDGIKVFLRDAITRDPALLTTPGMGAVITQLFGGLKGIDLPEQRQALPSPGQPTTVVDQPDAADGNEPDTEDTPPRARVASVGVADPVSLAVDWGSMRALDMAGKRRVKTNDRDQRDRLRDVEPHEYYRYMPPVTAAEVPSLIRGWDTGLDDVAGRYGLDADEIRAAVGQRARQYLTSPVVDAEVL